MSAQSPVLDNDSVIFEPSSFEGMTLLGPFKGDIQAQQNGININNKKACIITDIKNFSLKSTYNTSTYSASGKGTITIEELNSDQIATNAVCGSDKMLLIGSKFKAKFKVDSPASIPGGSSDGTPEYSGKGVFENVSPTGVKYS